ncbi:Eco57I restriction-modification methylase domain-containing protein [Spirillospora sp. NPDC048911]|uniref:Eco57I restriction-modification methylase domain-containing protein n=1 Tax=Spirillospora sp. NPDC048911 TaxID=3364527 RepID=UPI0037167115
MNLVTLGLLAARCKYEAGRSKRRAAGRLAVRHEDFLQWLDERWQGLPEPRLIFGNPPYTRHQQLTRSQKIAAQMSAGGLAPGQRAGLSTYFLAASLNRLGPQDSLCLLLPANWLEADYARAVRDYLWGLARRRVELHLFPDDMQVFPGAQVAAMVIFVGSEKGRRQPMMLHQITGSTATGFSSSTQERVAREGSAPPTFLWTELSRQNGRRQSTSSSTEALARIAIIRRGVATGANRFFLKTTQEVELLPAHCYVRAISRLREVPGDVLSLEVHQQIAKADVRCWLLQLSEDHAQDPEIGRLIADGVRQEIHERYLCKVRKPWYAVEQIPAPDLLIGPMGKQQFRVVANEAGAIPTNTLYGLRMRQGVPRSVRHRLGEWLAGEEGQQSMRAIARRHGDGLLKLEPGALAALRIPLNVLEH